MASGLHGRSGGACLSLASGGGTPRRSLHATPGFERHRLSVAGDLSTGLGLARRYGAGQEAGAVARGVLACRGACRAGSFGRASLVDGQLVVQCGVAPDGMRSLAGQGCGFRIPVDPGARWEGPEGPRDDAPTHGDGAAPSTSAEG
jgi:hypothetical protein